MKRGKKNSFKRRKNYLRAAAVFKKARKDEKAAQRLAEQISLKSDGFSSIEEKKIADYIRYRAEGEFYVPYDGDYYYERNPGREFYRLVPVMHKYPEVLAWLNSYNELNRKHQRAYVCELCRRGVTQEIEMALIDHYLYGCIGCENLLVALHKQGHKYSPEARMRMKWRCPSVYQSIYCS